MSDESQKRILALDLGTNVGWALQCGSSLLSGQECISPRRGEGPGMRNIRFRRFLDDIGPVDEVYYERVERHAGTTAAHVYGALESRLHEWCEDHGISTYAGIPVATIKKFATGKGNADKAMMVEAAQNRWPTQYVGGEEHDRADALWILACGLARNF